MMQRILKDHQVYVPAPKQTQVNLTAFLVKNNQNSS